MSLAINAQDALLAEIERQAKALQSQSLNPMIQAKMVRELSAAFRHLVEGSGPGRGRRGTGGPPHRRRSLR